MPKSRKKVKKKVGPVFHIYCEGEKTEPNYINGYLCKKFPGERRLKIEKTNKNTPVQLVEAAINAKNSKDCPEGDVFWVVYDRESTVKYSNELHQEAYVLADKNNISIALSNVCFEIWILLHFQENTAPYSNCDDVLSNSDLKKVHIKDYTKGNNEIFNQILDKVDDARKNAEMMNKATIKSADSCWVREYQWNPYTAVHYLLDAIDTFAKKL